MQKSNFAARIATPRLQRQKDEKRQLSHQWPWPWPRSLPPRLPWRKRLRFDSVTTHSRGNRLSIGGYGEVALTRNFYSDNVYRYSQPGRYKDDPGHGRFDIPTP